MTASDEIQKCLKCGFVTSVIWHGKRVTECPNCGSTEISEPIDLAKMKAETWSPVSSNVTKSP